MIAACTGLLTWLLGGRVLVTAAHVNALFVPGFKEWKVDGAAVTHLLGELVYTYVSVVMQSQLVQD
jgi:hypothetical protein